MDSRIIWESESAKGGQFLGFFPSWRASAGFLALDLLDETLLSSLPNRLFPSSDSSMALSSPLRTAATLRFGDLSFSSVRFWWIHAFSAGLKFAYSLAV